MLKVWGSKKQAFLKIYALSMKIMIFISEVDYKNIADSKDETKIFTI